MAETHRGTAQGRKKWVFPEKSSTEAETNSGVQSDAERQLAVPYRGPLYGGMCLGRKLVVIGVVDPQPDRFYIALTIGKGLCGEPPVDVALEMCVRFRDRQILRRSCVSGKWGESDRTIPYFPFIKAQPFKMELRCERSRFRVLIDGQSLFDFDHRILSLGNIDTLWIKGSVTINKLG